MAKRGRPFGVFKDIKGLRSGRLVAVRPVGSNAHRRALWEFACDCGGSRVATADTFQRGRVVQCGCERAPASIRNSLKEKHR